jgi:hypothetical protein
LLDFFLFCFVSILGFFFWFFCFFFPSAEFTMFIFPHKRTNKKKKKKTAARHNAETAALHEEISDLEAMLSRAVDARSALVAELEAASARVREVEGRERLAAVEGRMREAERAWSSGGAAVQGGGPADDSGLVSSHPHNPHGQDDRDGPDAPDSGIGAPAGGMLKTSASSPSLLMKLREQRQPETEMQFAREELRQSREALLRLAEENARLQDALRQRSADPTQKEAGITHQVAGPDEPLGPLRVRLLRAEAERQVALDRVQKLEAQLAAARAMAGQSRAASGGPFSPHAPFSPALAPPPPGAGTPGRLRGPASKLQRPLDPSLGGAAPRPAPGPGGGSGGSSGGGHGNNNGSSSGGGVQVVIDRQN